MKITNEIKTDWIEVEKLDEDFSQYPCIIVAIRVKTNRVEEYFERL
jgi:hypothetical protein